MTSGVSPQEGILGSEFQSTEVLGGVGLIAAVILFGLNTFVGALNIALLPSFMLRLLVASVVMIANGLKAM
jgi:hypothetical protein